MSTGTPAGIGEFCWNEIVTTDGAGAQAFYAGLFGWDLDPVSGSQGGYHLLKLGEDLVGGLYELMPDLKAQGVPPHWLTYVRVADVDATAAQVKRLGGSLVAGPLALKDVGRVVVFKDPEGALLAAWQVIQHAGATVHGERHSLCWMELMVRDVPRAAAFCAELFGWRPKAMEGGPFAYTEFYAGERPLAGLMAMEGPQWEGIPAHWMAYIRVEDVDAAAARATELGGHVCVPPRDIPGVGRFAVLDDPQGATFSVFRFSTQA